MSNDPDARHMDRFCKELLPGILTEVCKVSVPDAAAVASDVRLRAEAAAHLDRAERETLAAPFFEDSFAYDPADASPWMKALTTLVVRNSLLEELHSNGPVETGGIIGTTTYALAPLSHLFGARRREPLPGGVAGDPFAGLAAEYPRAWACLTALRQALINGGGRVGYKIPDTPPPDLPGAAEVTEAPGADIKLPNDATVGVIFSGIDPRFDQMAMHYLKTAQEGDLVLGLSSLSRISRNSRKLLRVLDFLLAYRAKVITTNSLLTSKEVWVRNKHIVKPNSKDMTSGLRDFRGLSGSHRKTVETYVDQLMKL